VSQGFKNTTKNIAFLNEELGETKTVIEQVKNQSITTQNRFQAFGAGVTASFTKAKFAVVSFGSEVSASLTKGALSGYQHGLVGVKDELRFTIERFKGFTRVAKVASVSIAGLGGAFLKFLPILGLLTAAWSILSSAFGFIKEALFGKELVDLSETLENNTEALETAAKSAELFATKLSKLPTTIDNVAKSTLLLANTFGALSENLTKTLEDLTLLGGFDDADEFLDAFSFGDLDEFKDQLDSTFKAMARFGELEGVNKILAKFGEISRLSGAEARKAAGELLKLINISRDVARSANDLNTLVGEAFEGLGKGLLAIDGGLPALTGIEQGFQKLQLILNTLDVKNVHLVASVITNLTHFELRELGLSDIAKEIIEINKPLDDFTSKLIEADKRLKILTAQRKRASEFREGTAQRAGIEGLIKKNSAEFFKLTLQVAGYTGLIDGVTARLKKQSAGIIKQLDIVNEKFKKITEAQKKIADIRDKNAISNLEQGAGLDKRLDSLKRITDAENEYLETITSNTNDSLTSINKAIDDVQEKIAANTTGKPDAGLADEQSKNFGKKQQIENKLIETRSKITANLIKQVKTLQSELSKTTKLAAAGLTVSKEQAETVEKDLFDALVKVGLQSGKNAMEAATFASKMTLASVAAERLN